MNEEPTKRIRKVHIVDIHKRDARPPGRSMIHQIRAVRADDGADDHERDAGPCRAGHEEGAAADLVDQEEGGEGAEAVDDAVDAGGEEGGLLRIRVRGGG